MRYLLLSDFHSNLEATLAVLAKAGSRGFDAAVVLGDLVGYGASPNEVVEAVRELQPVAAIRGNHDKVVCGVAHGEDFNPVALQAALLNRRVLSRENRDYLARLPRGPVRIDDRFLASHGTPLDEDEYLVDETDASRVFEATDFSLCFFGHTHLPGIFARAEGRVATLVPRRSDSQLVLEPGARYLINPGSVGQPRDEDPRASFALYDEARRSVSIHRVDYPIASTRERLREAGYPPILAERLSRGV